MKYSSEASGEFYKESSRHCISISVILSFRFPALLSEDVERRRLKIAKANCLADYDELSKRDYTSHYPFLLLQQVLLSSLTKVNSSCLSAVK